MHTFSRCHSLRNVSLPPSLCEIRAEVFVGCKALTSLVLPGNLRYIGHRAFGECAALSSLTYSRNKRGAWRRPYAAFNAFEECFKLAWCHLVTIRDCHPLSMAVGQVRAVTHVTVPSHRPHDGRFCFITYNHFLVCSLMAFMSRLKETTGLHSSPR